MKMIVGIPLLIFNVTTRKKEKKLKIGYVSILKTHRKIHFI